MSRALEHIRGRTALQPEIGLILGSGMSGVADAVTVDGGGAVVPYADVPGLVASTVQSHAGEFRIGRLHGRDVVAMCGRVHMYEGHDARQATAPVRLMAAMGARTLIITNAAGGLDPELSPGELVAIEDHISLVNLAGGDPLRGTDDRFVSMNGAYDAALLDALRKAGVTRRGTYFHAAGPSFETPAEVRMMRMLGGDMVGMSTVPEVMVARALAMRVCAVSAISNACVHSLDDPHVTTAEEAWETLQTTAPKMGAFIERLMPLL